MNPYSSSSPLKAKQSKASTSDQGKMTSDKKSPSAIGVVAPVFSSATDATNPPPSTTIQVPAPSTASDATLVAALTSLVNNVYGEAEGTIYKSVFSRTSKTQIAAHLAAGELAVASSSSTGSKPVGCVFVKRLTPSVGEFGMLAVDPAVRGTGLGRDLVRFAEDRCRRELGVSTMRLELLVPVHFEHEGKTRLQAWYTRLGYVMTELGDFGEAYPALNALLAGPTEYRVFEKKLVA